MRFDLIVRHGEVVGPGGPQIADIGVSDGRISALGDLSGADADEVLDATGLEVYPGGVDSHTHVRWPFLDATSNDDFHQASIAALHGGTTTIVDWALPAEDSALEGIARRKAEALSDGVLVDFALHCVLTPALRRGYDEMEEVVAEGLPCFKCYLTYRKRGLLTNDSQLVEVLKQARDLGAIVTVHAENPSLHEAAEAELRAAGRDKPRHFREAKDHLVEAEAIHRAIYLAEWVGAALLIRHVSTAQGVELIRLARSRGSLVLGETCPHYLVLTDEVYDRPDGRHFICSPPIKTSVDQEALWEGLADDTLSIVGADHCAFTAGQKAIGDSAFDVPNGLPGIETRFPLLYAFGVASGRLGKRRFCEVVSENAARIAGIFPQKGVIRVGSDADLVLVDPSERRQISARDLRQATDWTPYEGIEVQGYPAYTVLRGELVVERGAFSDPKGAGRFLPGVPGGFRSVS